jgi:hypothetical protein
MATNSSGHRAAILTGDVLGGIAVILLIPVAILAVGIPFALGVRALLWVTGQL